MMLMLMMVVLLIDADDDDGGADLVFMAVCRPTHGSTILFHSLQSHRDWGGGGGMLWGGARVREGPQQGQFCCTEMFIRILLAQPCLLCLTTTSCPLLQQADLNGLCFAVLGAKLILWNASGPLVPDQQLFPLDPHLQSHNFGC